MKRAATLLLLSLPLSLPAQGTVYRWVDAQGQVHYSQTPPPTIGAEPQAIRPVPAGPPPAAAKSAAPPPKTPAAPAAAAPDPKAEREARARRCTEARERIQYLEEKTPRRLGIEQPDGSLARMTEEQFQERLDKARDEAIRNCGP